MTKARNLADLISNSSVDTSEITDAAITTNKLADDAVTAAKLKDTDSFTVAGLTSTGNINFGDNDKAIFGAGSDLQIYHDGDNSYIADVGTGDLKIQGANVRLENPSGVRYFQGSSGNAYLYNSGDIKLATTSTGVDVTGTITSDGLTVDGSGTIDLTSDSGTTLKLSRDGSAGQIASIVMQDGGDAQNRINSSGGALEFEYGPSNTNAMKIANNGDISFYNSAGTSAQMVWDAGAESLNFADNSKAIFGAGSDLQIYHDSNNSYIKDAGTGYLVIQANTVGFANSGNNENIATFVQDGAVTLFHDNATKLATTSTGVDITGEVKADKFTNDEALPTVRPSLLLDFANSKTLDPRITFTRGSTATYWDGKTTAKAEENLVARSEEFNMWSVTKVSVTANDTTAPDGTTTADRMTADGTSGFHWVGVSSGTGHMMSVYVKAGTNDLIQILVGNSGTPFANFDLTNGTVTGFGTNCSDSSIASVGNGWYRCTLHSTDELYNMYVAIISTDSANRAETNTESGYVYLWGAQVEDRGSSVSTPTAYTATTSSPIVKYQPTLQTASSGEARFDHDPVTGESKGLLIEEARTNLHLTSESATNHIGLNNMDVISNDAIAPDGAQTADFVYPTGGTGRHEIQPRWSATSGVTYAYSAYIKAVGTITQISLSQTGGNQVSALFDLINGTVTNRGSQSGSSAEIEDVGNGWYRCILIGAATTTNPNYSMYMSPADENGTLATQSDTVFTNLPANGANGILLWGVQVEVGAFPTSYIPTSGSTVTRSQDKGEMDTAGWWSDNEGTLFTKTSALHYDSASNSDIYRVFWVRNTSSGTYGDTYHHSHQKNGGMRVAVNSSGSNHVSLQVTTGNTSANQIANLASSFYYDNSNAYTVAASGNGNTVQTDNSSNVAPLGLNKAYIGWHSDGTEMNGHIRKISFHPKRLSNATLQAMTEE
jgi:hypothetical protein